MAGDRGRLKRHRALRNLFVILCAPFGLFTFFAMGTLSGSPEGIAVLVATGAAFLTLFVLAIVQSALFDRELQRLWQALAASRGWGYREEDHDVPARYLGFTPFGQGIRRVALHALSGTQDGTPFQAFTYEYTIRSGGKKKSDRTYRYAVVAAPMPIHGPNLTIAPELLGKQVWDAIGGTDIDFESDEFSRKFWVKCDDARWCYDIVTPDMMDWLLQRPGGWSWQWRGTTLVGTRRGRLELGDAVPAVETIAGIRRRLPRHRLVAA